VPEVDTLIPTSGWPGPNGTGTQIVITGRGFHPTPEMDLNRVTFAGPNGSRVLAPVLWASPNEIEYAADGAVEDQDPFDGRSPYPLGFTGLEGLAVSAGGTLYLAVTGQNTLKWGIPGSWGVRFFPDTPPRQFDRPSGIAADEHGNVYVANSGLHRIEQYGPTLFGNDGHGNPFPVWGSEGDGDGQFQFPRAVDAATINGQIFIFIADTHNRRVVRTRPDGSDFRVFDMPQGVGSIHGVAAHDAGDVYCSDTLNHRILHFDADGNFLDQFGADELDFPMGLDVDFDGFVYVADNGSRTVKKFGVDFQLLAEFGLNPGRFPQEPPPEDLVDPVDVAVGEDKAVWIADRVRNHIVKWIPRDAQQLWVTVPEGAITGPLIVETEDGPANLQPIFRVLEVGEVNVNWSQVTQGVEEYPLVCRKKTAIIVQMSTPMTGEFPNAHPVSWWGSPVADSSTVTIRRDGALVGTLTEFQIIAEVPVQDEPEAMFHLLFEVPLDFLSEHGQFEFEISLERPGFLSFQESILKEAQPRRRLKIGAYVWSHLRTDGTPVPDGELPDDVFFIWLGDDAGTLSWLDRNNMLLGFVNFNRVFPSPHSFYDIQYIAPVPSAGLSDGITSDEAETILLGMEVQRVILNELADIRFDFLLAIVDRANTPDDWNGITAAESGWKTAIVSIGSVDGVPIVDFGARVIAHEIAHQFGIVNPGSPRHITEDHSNNQFLQTAFPAWNSAFGMLVDEPASIMFDSRGEPLSVLIDDINGFFEESFDGELEADYADLFNQMPNPHPRDFSRQELPCDSTPLAPKRPPRSKGNLTLVGTVTQEGKAEVHYSHVGRGDTPVTPRFETGYELVQVGPDKQERLRWPVPVSFRLLGAAGGGSTAPSRGTFRVTAPWMEDTAQVRIEHNGAVLATQSVPTGVPRVEILSPRGGERLGAGDVLEIHWAGSHPDHARLTYRIEYSSNGGQSFRLIQAGLRQTTLSWHNRIYPGGDQAVIRVVANDGFHSASATSPPFVVERKPPQVHLIWPRNGQVIAQGQPVRMMAMAWDAEQGALGDRSISWLLDGLIQVGEGAEQRLTTVRVRTPRGEFGQPLPLGEHTLTVRAIDRDGNVAEDSVAILVGADSDGDGYTDEEEIESGTDPLNPFDHPGSVPRSPFGQWQLSREGRWTRFEISNLTARRVTLEITVIRETGQPLRNYPVAIREGAQARGVSTDRRGRFQLRLEGHASATFELRPEENLETEVLYGYSMIRLLAVHGSRTSTFMAHGWIRQGALTGATEPAFEGTVVIHGGEPFTLRAPVARRTMLRPRKPRRKRRMRDLGVLIGAAGKAVLRRTVAGPLPDGPVHGSSPT